MLNAIRRPSIATGAAQASGYEQRHHPLQRRSRLLHQNLGELQLFPTMGATSHLYKGEEESLTGSV